MKQIKWIIIFIFPVILCTSCLTVKSIQRQMAGIQSELFYELTTPVYSENINDTIYLNLIDYSAILPYTTVKKKGGKVLPFLVYNLVQNKYEVTLGEGSLIQPYRDFLMDALLAQCNRSSCFTLKMKNDNAGLPDSALILEVKVNKNVTTAKMTNNDVAFINPFYDGYFQGFTNWEVNQPVSWLEISTRLVQQEKCLWEKTYTVTQDLSYHRRGIEKETEAYETCIDNMTECLSYTTKGVVENISRNLHLLMLQKKAY